jgi:GT2 family glycosyltransferase
MSDVSVIVLDVAGGEMLRDCLASIAAQTLQPAEVIVFDNGSRVPTVAPGARVIRSDRNRGFAGGANAAFAQSRGAFIALINNDVTLGADWLATVRAAIDADPRLAAVQTVLRRDAATIDGAGISIADGTFRQIGHGLPIGVVVEKGLEEAWGVSATATLYRREALGEWMFDERFFAYYEDVDLCARLHENGWHTKVLDAVKATHRGSQSASILGRDALRLRTRNRYWVARLHRGVGRASALLWEDVRLALRGRTSLRGIVQGMGTMNPFSRREKGG